MLAPTTILAQQHFGTFSERLKDYPFTIEHVSRFRSAKEQREAIAGFNEGQVDILIGTHRLLGRDVRGKDLGLHGRRRGAALRRQAEGAAAPAQAEGRRHRDERDADPAHAADVAGRACATSRSSRRRPRAAGRSRPTSASTTRSSSGRRSMREKERGGQAFFVHNRVETIDETAERLRGLCPGVRFEVAHGQMDEKRARGADARASCAARPTCSWPRASSSRASTSRRPTR